MLNICIHEGRFTKDPELRPAGQSQVLNFTLGCEGSFDKNTNKPKPVFINFVAWGKTAETIAKFHKKGDVIKIESTEEDASYLDQKTNQKVYKNIKKVDRFHFAAGNNNNNQQGNNGGYQQQGYQGQPYGEPQQYGGADNNPGRDYNPYEFSNNR